MFSVKLFLANGEIRRLGLDFKTTYPAFLELLQNFSIAEFQYQDEERDWITCSSELEFAEAITVLESMQGHVLRIRPSATKKCNRRQKRSKQPLLDSELHLSPPLESSSHANIYGEDNLNSQEASVSVHPQPEAEGNPNTPRSFGSSDGAWEVIVDELKAPLTGPTSHGDVHHGDLQSPEEVPPPAEPTASAGLGVGTMTQDGIDVPKETALPPSVAAGPWAAGVERLVALGLCDRAQGAALLEQQGGDVVAVVEAILSSPQTYLQ